MISNQLHKLKEGVHSCLRCLSDAYGILAPMIIQLWKPKIFASSSPGKSL